MLELLSHSKHSSITGTTRKINPKGVLWQKKYKHWFGLKKKNGTQYFTAYFKNKTEAETAYKELCLKLSEGK